MDDRERRVRENLGLAHACANRFRGRGVEYDDLFQAGCVGLVKAADGFEPARGLRFSTYAVPVILGEIKRIFRDGGSVKVARPLKELSLRARREEDRFLLQEGRPPTVGELAGLLGVPPEEAALAVNAGKAPLSLTAGEGGAWDVPVEAPEEAALERVSLRQALAGLPPGDRALIEQRYFGRKTQAETARALGMTQVQVSRREKKILALLRERLAG